VTQPPTEPPVSASLARWPHRQFVVSVRPATQTRQVNADDITHVAPQMPLADGAVAFAVRAAVPGEFLADRHAVDRRGDAAEPVASRVQARAGNRTTPTSASDEAPRSSPTSQEGDVPSTNEDCGPAQTRRSALRTARIEALMELG